ncbi:MAG: hypothetical protein ACHQ50_04475 [Fimbriimonadales bacterium]
MSLRKISVSGRASILAVAALAVLVLAGGLVLARKASAQGGPGRLAMAFAPVFVDPPNPDRGGGDNILIGLLLPAVRQGSTPFKVEVMMGDGSVTVLSTPGGPARTTSFFDVFFQFDRANGGGLFLHLRNRKTGEEATAPANDPSVAIRILPAVQDGEGIQPLAGGLTVSGNRNAVLGDGSVIPIPFQYGLLLPAVRQGG